MEKQDIEIFYQAVSDAYNDASSKICYSPEGAIFTKIKYDLQKNNLEDACVLLKMLFKEIDNHNTKIRTKISLIENIKYCEKWRNSKLLTPFLKNQNQQPK